MFQVFNNGGDGESVLKFLCARFCRCYTAFSQLSNLAYLVSLVRNFARTLTAKLRFAEFASLKTIIYKIKWWRRRESNSRPERIKTSIYERRALLISLI